MREILFRGYNKNVKRFIYGDLTHFENEIRIIEKNGYSFFVDPETVGQFTGLKDCNGKDIYQGDICKIYFDVKRVEDYIYNSLTEIEMATGSRIFVVESPIFNNQVEFTADKIEVIGNIHKNPELLK